MVFLREIEEVRSKSRADSREEARQTGETGVKQESTSGIRKAREGSYVFTH